MRLAPLFGLAGIVACAPSQQAVTVESTGAALSVDYFGDTDVVGFNFLLQGGDECPAETETGGTAFNVDLVDGIFPGNVSLSGMQFDNDSRHLGADLFVSVPAGCYRVIARPASEIGGDHWTPSSDCSVATSPTFNVVDGSTIEIDPLISQCVGDPIGALDVLVLLNNPPKITVEIDEKFNYECEPVRVCATIEDPNDDPIKVQWEKVTGYGSQGYSYWIDEVEGGPQVVGFQDGHRIWKSCVDITTRFTDSYEFKVTVWDVTKDGVTTIETVVQGQEDDHELMSNDMLQFPIHTNWIEEPLCIDDDGDAVPAPGVSITRRADCDYTTTEEWYCTKAPADIIDYVCPNGYFDAHALYPDCPDVEICDDLDNDGDGQIDEGFKAGHECTYSTKHEGNAAAGTFEEVTSTYNDVTETWTFTTSFGAKGTHVPDSYTVAISDGPNPKGQAQLALVYVDCTNGRTEPQVTVYAYNGQNNDSSYKDGSNDPGTQAPDKITNSVDDSLLLVSGSCNVVAGTSSDIEFVLDVSDVNAHNPQYVESYAWEGIMQDEKFGIWLHPRAGSHVTYDSDNYITAYTRVKEGWLDLANRHSTCKDVCIAEDDLH